MGIASMDRVKKVLVTGVCGQLGHDVANELLRRGYDVIGSDIKSEEEFAAIDCMTPNRCKSEVCGSFRYVTLDICSSDDTRRELLTIKPDAVVHCAAWTAVDVAEEASVHDKVYSINAFATKNIAEICKELSCKMVYISTDYVFGGQGNIPWGPDCQDFNPLNVYGKSKLAGEQAVSGLLDKFFIVRIAWVFGLHGGNFVKTMLRLGRTHDEIRVVNDQIGTPTYTFDLARLLVDMLETDKYGYYHATNEGGYISWYDFACEIFRQAGYSTKVIPVSTAEYGQSKAARPYNSRLDRSKLMQNGFVPLPDWRDALARYLEEVERI